MLTLVVRLQFRVLCCILRFLLLIVVCAPRRDAAADTKDDVLLVGRSQVLSFDILDEVLSSSILKS